MISGQFSIVTSWADATYQDIWTKTTGLTVEAGTARPPAPADTVAQTVYVVSAPSTGAVGNAMGAISLYVLNGEHQWLTSNSDLFQASGMPFGEGSSPQIQAVSGVVTFNNLIPSEAGTFQLRNRRHAA